MGFLHMGHTSSVVAHSTHVPWPHRNAMLRGFSRQMAHMLASSISRTWAWSDSKEWSVSKYFSSFSLNSAGLAGAFFPTDEKKEKILKIAGKIICLEYLHGLPYTHWRCCILNGMHMSTTVCFSIDFQIRLKFHILAFECFWIFHAVFDIQAPKMWTNESLSIIKQSEKGSDITSPKSLTPFPKGTKLNVFFLFITIYCSKM